MLTLEQKVGIVFFIGLILLGVLTILVGDISFKKTGYRINVYFDDIGGLNKGDPVRLGGMKIGKVEEMDIDPIKGKIIVKLLIDSKYKIGRDAVFSIEASSLMGGKYISVTLTKSNTYLKNGETVKGKSIKNINKLISKLNDIADDVKSLVVSLNKNQARIIKQIGGMLKENRRDIRAIMKGAAGAVPRIINVVESLKKIAQQISSGKGTMGKLIFNEELHNNINEALILAKDMEKSIKKLSEKLNMVVENNQENINNIINNLSEAVPHLKKSLSNIEKITGKIAEGEGTIGKLVNDEEIHTKLETTMDSLNNAAKEVKTFTGKASRIKTYVGGGYFFSPSKSEGIGKVFLRIEPSENKFYLVGVSNLSSDAIDEYNDTHGKEEDDYNTKVDLQLGWRFFDRKITLRAGLLEGKGGGAVEYMFNEDTYLITEARDTWEEEQIDRFLLRSYLSLRIWKGLKLYAGVEDIVEDASFLGGISLEYSDEDIKYLVGLLGMK